jgi:hypothetical protein
MKNIAVFGVLMVALVACGGGGDETAEAAASEALSPQAARIEGGMRRTAGSIPSAPGATQIVFSGYTFQVRSGAGGPGPNAWSPQNVWVDDLGHLHLKISNNAGSWSSAEIFTNESLGFGTYQFKMIGHPESFDNNVVLGLFNYTTPEIGPDGTNEIDIEFATWGGAQPQHGNWTPWPAVAGPGPTSHAFDPVAPAGLSTHRFNWTSRQILFESLAGLSDHRKGLNASWTFAPTDYATLIPQNPLPLHMNFWLFQGNAPTNGLEAEIVISEFKFTPARRARR